MGRNGCFRMVWLIVADPQKRVSDSEVWQGKKQAMNPDHLSTTSGLRRCGIVTARPPFLMATCIAPHNYRTI
jgi:hypothetical protein